MVFRKFIVKYEWVINMNLVDLLNDSKQFNETQNIICQYILNHSEDVVKMSARALAKETYTNASTIIRFVQKIGYENYNDFKIHLVHDLKEYQAADIKITEKEKSISIVDKISELEKNVIEETKNQLSLQQIEYIAELLKKTTYIDFISSDANACIADYACHLFFLERKIANNYTTSNQQLYLTLTELKEHVVFVISRRGEDEKILKVVQELHKNKEIKIIAITGRKDSPIARYCDEILSAIHIGSFVELRDMIFQVSAQYIINCLFSLLFTDDYQSIVQFNDEYEKIYLK